MARSSTNPFPGVNPYIESEGFWEDFHRRLTNYVCEAILGQLPTGYDARIDERVDLLDRETGTSIRKPDVAVIETGPRSWLTGSSGGTALADDIAVIEVDQLPVAESREVWLEIRRLDDESLVTSIEILSPSSKSPTGYPSFHNKRIQLLEGGANTVDIDLLLHGIRPEFRQPLPPGDYFIFTSRYTRRPKTQVMSWPLTRALPSIDIPLRHPDPDITIDLNAVYHQTFERGQYPRRLRYANPIQHADARRVEWARSQAVQ